MAMSFESYLWFRAGGLKGFNFLKWFISLVSFPGMIFRKPRLKNFPWADQKNSAGTFFAIHSFIHSVPPSYLLLKVVLRGLRRLINGKFFYQARGLSAEIPGQFIGQEIIGAAIQKSSTQQFLQVAVALPRTRMN